MYKNIARNNNKSKTAIFFDRIKTQHPNQDYLVNQKLNLNQIRQSSYKLPRSKSQNRNDHSIQRKKPLNISKKTIAGHYSIQRSLQKSQKQQSTMPTSKNNTQALKKIQFYQNLSTNKIQSQDQQQNHRFSNNNYSANIKYNVSDHQIPQNVQQQGQILDYLKNIWDNVQKIRQKSFFVAQIAQLEEIMKNIIVKMAKVKYNICSEQIQINSKQKLFSENLFSNIKNSQKIKQYPKSIIKKGPQKLNKLQRKKQSPIGHQNQRTQNIQFKKIMYILEQQSKKVKQQKTPFKRQQKQNNNNKTKILDESKKGCKQIEELNNRKGKMNLKDISNTYNCKNTYNNELQSSYNSQRQASLYTLYEFQKTNQFINNDKIFLKNIVKKVNKNNNELNKVNNNNYNIAQKQIMINQSQNLMKQSLQYSNIQNNFPNKTYQKQENSSIKSFLSISSSSEQNKQKSIENRYQSLSISQQCKQNQQTNESLINQQSNQSKRLVLNQIISMLNNKYHKNIQFQPKP